MIADAYVPPQNEIVKEINYLVKKDLQIFPFLKSEDEKFYTVQLNIFHIGTHTNMHDILVIFDKEDERVSDVEIDYKKFFTVSFYEDDGMKFLESVVKTLLKLRWNEIKPFIT